MIGIDVVVIDRIEKFVKKFGEKGLSRFLNEAEMGLTRSAKTQAGFWAAKEAASKALGCGIGRELGFHDMVITKTDKGAPLLEFDESIKQKFDIKSAHLSITHDGNLAIAVVFINKG